MMWYPWGSGFTIELEYSFGSLGTSRANFDIAFYLFDERLHLLQ